MSQEQGKIDKEEIGQGPSEMMHANEGLSRSLGVYFMTNGPLTVGQP